MNETWRAIAGWEGIYEVSDLGRVRRNDRPTRPIVGGLLCSDSGAGRTYRIVGLQDRATGRRREQVLVHRLVARAFVSGETADRRWVNHLDGDGLHNAATNLEWCTPSENSQHGYRVLGRRRLFGEANGRAKLTAADAAAIRDRYASGGVTHRELAADFGVSRPMVSYIIRGENWA